MATPSTRPDQSGAGRPRAQPPIRWPHPDRHILGFVGLWAVGLVVALLLPAAIVSPTAEDPPTRAVLLAFGSTLLGAAVMIGAAALLWRRTRDSAVMLLGLVPGVACIAGGVILSATKIGAL